MKIIDRSYTAYYFLLSMILIYALVFFINPDKMFASLNFSFNIVKQIVPIFALVFLLMVVTNYFVAPQKIAKYIGKQSKKKKWFLAVLTGIISTGPIYMWYPMLKELGKKGASNGFTATFLYNRAIKPPLLPMIIYYFGIKFTIVLTVVMIIFSIVQGKIIEEVID